MAVFLERCVDYIRSADGKQKMGNPNQAAGQPQGTSVGLLLMSCLYEDEYLLPAHPDVPGKVM